MEKIFLLLVLFEIKHFLADYPMQNEYMLGKFKDGKDFILPLVAHSLAHAAFTFGIAFAFTFSLKMASLLSLADFVIHFGMDRIKAGKKYLGRFKSLGAKEFPLASDIQKRHNRYFWWSLCFDQMVHHLTHYVLIACIVFLV